MGQDSRLPRHRMRSVGEIVSRQHSRVSLLILSPYKESGWWETSGPPRGISGHFKHYLQHWGESLMSEGEGSESVVDSRVADSIWPCQDSSGWWWWLETIGDVTVMIATRTMEGQAVIFHIDFTRLSECFGAGRQQSLFKTQKPGRKSGSFNTKQQPPRK